MRTTQKKLRNMIEYGRARDISNLTLEDLKALEEREGGLWTIASSIGTYGVTGRLYQGRTTGELYAGIGRCLPMY